MSDQDNIVDVVSYPKSVSYDSVIPGSMWPTIFMIQNQTTGTWHLCLIEFAFNPLEYNEFDVLLRLLKAVRNRTDSGSPDSQHNLLFCKVFVPFVRIKRADRL